MASPELPKLKNKEQTSAWIAAFLVALITFIVYLPALRNGFVNWDDDILVYENPNLRSIDIPFIRWALTDVSADLWNPMLWLSFAFDYTAWGLNPFGYHLTNIILHAFNTFVVFILVLRLIKCKHNSSPFILHPSLLISASVTALLFGIHPLHVESVAWVTERKDVLYSFFFLASLFVYLRYTFTNLKKYYLLSLIFFTLSLMSKPMAVSLPAVLLILDFYPLKRLTWEGGIKKTGGVLVEKLPFLLLGTLLAALAVWVHPGLEQGTYPLEGRIFIAVYSFTSYLVKMPLPFNLAPIYPPISIVDIFSLGYIRPFIGLTAIIILCIWSSRRSKVFSAIWLYYTATLMPVLGQTGAQHYGADRYTYLPSIGPFLLAGLGIAALLGKITARRNRLAVIAVLLLISSILGIKTVRQISIWKDSITLWSYEIRLFPDSQCAAYNNRGVAYYNEGRYDEAIKDFSKAIAVNPDYVDPYNNRGIIYNSSGQYDKAIKDFDKAIALKPGSAMTYNNRGVAYYNKGQYDRAIQDHNQAIILKPDYVDAYSNRGTDYDGKGQYEMAIKDYNKAIALNQDFAMAYNNRGFTYYNKGQYDRAIPDFQKACSMGYERGCNNYKIYSQRLR